MSGPTAVYLNTFSPDLVALDMTGHEEFQDLLQSAADLGIAAPERPRYRSRNTVVRHQRFHFLEWGDPDSPPLLLLHGGNQSAHSWDLVSLELSRRYHVFAVDQRGHGDSEWSRGAHYGIDEMALDAEAVSGALGVERPVVVGHSMGGLVALRFALAAGTRLAGLVMVDIGPEVGERGARMVRDFVGRNVEFDDLEEFLDRVQQYDPYRSRAHIERTVKYNLLRRADGRYVSKSDRRRYQMRSEGAKLPGVPEWAEIQALDLPVLVVRGAESNVLEPEAAERFAAALPHGELCTVADCGHNVASQNTRGFLDAVAPFLDRVAVGRAAGER